jgi:hypothetical protein
VPHQDANGPEGTTDQHTFDQQAYTSTLVSSPGGTKMHQGSITWAYERFLQLPVVVALAGLWLAGVALISLFGLAFYVLIYLLGMVSGA